MESPQSLPKVDLTESYSGVVGKIPRVESQTPVTCLKSTGPGMRPGSPAPADSSGAPLTARLIPTCFLPLPLHLSPLSSLQAFSSAAGLRGPQVMRLALRGRARPGPGGGGSIGGLLRSVLPGTSFHTVLTVPFPTAFGLLPWFCGGQSGPVGVCS